MKQNSEMKEQYTVAVQNACGHQERVTMPRRAFKRKMREYERKATSFATGLEQDDFSRSFSLSCAYVEGKVQTVTWCVPSTDDRHWSFALPHRTIIWNPSLCCSCTTYAMYLVDQGGIDKHVIPRFRANYWEARRKWIQGVELIENTYFPDVRAMLGSMWRDPAFASTLLEFRVPEWPGVSMIGFDRDEEGASA